MNDIEFRKTQQYLELMNIFELVESKSHPRSITEDEQYESIMNDYVTREHPTPEEQWIMELE